MSVSIRMARGGRKKLPFYHVVVADSRRSRNGKFIEKLGHFNPLIKEDALVWNTERVAYWLDQGAQPSDRVTKFILDQKIGSEKVRARLAKKRQNSIDAVQARLAKEKAVKDAELAAAKAEEEAAAAAAAAEAAAAEAPAEAEEANDAEKAAE